MKTWKVLLLLLLSSHLCSLVSSQDCLRCLYEACFSDVNPQMVVSDSECCKCFLNIPENDPAPSLIECREAFMALRNENSFTVDGCCDSAHETLLDTYIQSSTEGSNKEVCSTGYIFNDTAGPILTQVEAHEYLIPSFTFNCRGCITELQMLIDSTAVPNELTLHLWTKYKKTSGDSDSSLYERNESFPITITPNVTPRDGYEEISSVISTLVCFEPGDVFGFLLPPGSSVVLGPAGTDGVVGYKLEERSHECIENELFEPSEETSLGGLPLITLKIGSEPFAMAPTTVTIPTSSDQPSSSFQVTPTTSPTGPTGTDPTGTGMPTDDEKDQKFPLYIIIATVVGAIIFVLGICIIVSVAVITRLKWQMAPNGVVKHGPSTTAGSEERTKVRRTSSLSEITTDVERSVIVAKRNEAYMTNSDVIPAAWNEAYGVVGLEDMNFSNKEDTTDCTYETSHLLEEHEYDYVY